MNKRGPTLSDGRDYLQLTNGHVISVDEAFAAGYTGRDPDTIRAHIQELELEGVAAPDTIPALYPLIPTLLTNDSVITVIGHDTTPEVEVVLLLTTAGILVTVGSDHTDRRLERDNVLQSKNVCPKPVGNAAWKLENIADHWDRLEISATVGGARTQSGSLGALLPPQDIIKFVGETAGVPRGVRAIFCGTIPTDLPPPAESEVQLELYDPVLRRALTHAYTPRIIRGTR